MQNLPLFAYIVTRNEGKNRQGKRLFAACGDDPGERGAGESDGRIRWAALAGSGGRGAGDDQQAESELNGPDYVSEWVTLSLSLSLSLSLCLRHFFAHLRSLLLPFAACSLFRRFHALLTFVPTQSWPFRWVD